MEPFEVLSLFAEVAVAITGFSGVVLAFGDRARSAPGGADRILFMTLFRGSLTPLAIIALAFVVNATGIEPPTVWRVCSAAHAIIIAAILVSVRPQVPRPDRVGIVTVGGFLSLGLSLANLLAIQDFWPVLAVICWGLGVSLWAFVSLLGSSRAA